MFFKKKNSKAKKAVSPADWLIVGLGNPGSKYAQTRHNAGFIAIDVLADELGGSYWKDEAGAMTCTIKDNRSDTEIVLAKPQTFMNLSGNSIKKLCDKYGINPEENLIVIADELDLLADEVRLKKGGGHAGHNGHRSTINSLGTRDYLRIRIGVGRPPGKMDAADYVLQPLRPESYEDLVESAFQAAELAKSHLAETLFQR
ncbi:MAG: aminoacyl-tRNA hydrolase [Coriobacteriia bacterium]|nr:aminoacyl-tRNA hydrolase [Coriobacteriia bacterium]MCL2606422.1 aminoacyl-tRNA hydrolase [Coriobacteriia bacterium]